MFVFYAIKIFSNIQVDTHSTAHNHYCKHLSKTYLGSQVFCCCNCCKNKVILNKVIIYVIEYISITSEHKSAPLISHLFKKLTCNEDKSAYALEVKSLFMERCSCDQLTLPVFNICHDVNSNWLLNCVICLTDPVQPGLFYKQPRDSLIN